MYLSASRGVVRRRIGGVGIGASGRGSPLLLSRKLTAAAGSRSVVDVYRNATLISKLYAAFESKGIDTSPGGVVNLEYLAAVSEFHIGGAEATKHLVAQLPFSEPGCRVLDIGCGIGGFSRYVAHTYPNCSVHGIDITPDYIDACSNLKTLTNTHNSTFTVGSATELPVEDQSIDIACMLHVGMNILNKDEIFREANRVLRPGGVFAVYDVFRCTDTKPGATLLYPVPWADESSQSFVEHSDCYLLSAEKENFEMIGYNPRKDFALKFFEPMAKRLSNNLKMPPYSLALLFGEENAEAKISNLIEMIKGNVIFPAEIIFRKKI
jgi:SAM-dependent methyltransferase